MATDTHTSLHGKRTARDFEDVPVVIEVRGVEKSFEIASHKVDSLKERLTAFSQQEHKMLRALQGVSFRVNRGEVLGEGDAGDAGVLLERVLPVGMGVDHHDLVGRPVAGQHRDQAVG